MSHKLRLYNWYGITHVGDEIKGFIFASNIDEACDSLRKKNIIIRNIVKKQRLLTYPVKSKELALFTRQIATALATGMPFVEALSLIISYQKNHFFKLLLLSIKEDIESGLMFSEAIVKHLKLFGVLFYNLVLIGESTSSLGIILDKMATYLNNRERQKQQLIKVLSYPIVLILISFFVTICLFIVIIPEFESLFLSLDSELPTATLLMLRCSYAVQKYWFMFMMLFFMLSSWILYLYKKSSKFIRMIDKIILHIPIINKITKEILLARFMNALSITLFSGLSLIESLRLASGIIRNKIYVEIIHGMTVRLSQGENMQSIMRQTNFFPEFVINMLSLGEETAKIDQMAANVANYYEKSVEQFIDTINNLLEPLILIFLGVGVGGLIYSLYSPIIKLGSVI